MANQSPNLLNWLLTNGTMPNMNMPTTQQPINQAQFQQFIPKITDENLKQLVAQARQQGIGEEQIKQGLEFVMNMR